MVNSTARKRLKQEIDEQRTLSATIQLSEALDQDLRFEAAAYSIETRAAVETMATSGLQLGQLFGDSALCTEAHNAFRFVRHWVDPEYGVPFLSSSDIISLRPESDAHISRKRTKRLEDLIIKPWDVLISCSGTIGNIGLASKSFSGMALSQDAIRLRAEDPQTAAYVAAFLRSRYGRPQVRQATYGSVIKHIEPQHLTRILVPQARSLIESVGSRVKRAYELRDDANDLLDLADEKLHRLLALPKIAQAAKGPVVIGVRNSQLADRFEASYHTPSVSKILSLLARLNTLPLGDARVTSSVRAVTKFRKRVYVPRGGIPMLSSKQLLQLDPVDVKRLAKGAHAKDLPEIALKEGMIAVSCSGTIGRVQIIPAYMDGWTANQHAIRLIAAKDMNAGYLYAWLASEYGQRLTRRYSYGSVILEIDRNMLISVPIPYPNPSVRADIGDPVLAANKLRDQAWKMERGAIDDLESAIESPSQSHSPRASR